jgi:hypothetical protein
MASRRARRRTQGRKTATTINGVGTGDVRFFKRMRSSDDAYFQSATPANWAWVREHWYSSESFSTFFDQYTDEFPNALSSKNFYAIYTSDTALVAAHPEWILKDAQGNFLYIPYGCSGGTCPQYAADIGNVAFRQYWVQTAAATLAQGYRGLWIDDVNLAFRVGNGNGDFLAPQDPRTGTTMTYENWRKYGAEHAEQIRAALSGYKLLHNSIWFVENPSGYNDQYVQRQIKSCDWINLERGFNDAGIGGGTGDYSLSSLLAHIDAIHAAGPGVVLDAFDMTPAGREYNLAAYFLIGQGNDGVGLNDMTEANWLPMFDIKLGIPSGPRYTWNNVLRRDYSNGMILFNGPEEPQRTLALPQQMQNLSNALVTSVTLGPTNGAVLRFPVPGATNPITEGVQPAALVWEDANGTTKTTVSFSPAASTLLVALVNIDGSETGGAVTAAVTDSTGGTWTLLKRQNTVTATVGGSAEVWCRDLSSAPGALTVSVIGSGTGMLPGGSLVVRSLVNASPTQNGATAGATPTMADTMAVSVAAATGNRVYGTAFNYEGPIAITPNAATTAVLHQEDFTNGAVYAAFKSSADTTGTATYGYTNQTRGQIAAVTIKAVGG